MQMQLTEALQGILPIPPTEDFHLEDSRSVNIQDARNSVGFVVIVCVFVPQTKCAFVLVVQV